MLSGLNQIVSDNQAVIAGYQTKWKIDDQIVSEQQHQHQFMSKLYAPDQYMG
jgi:hypothetical protein